MCVLVHTVHCCPHITKQPTRNAESTVGQVCFCGTPDQRSRLQLLYSHGRLLWGKGFPVLCQCGGAGSWLSSSVLFPAGWTLSSPCHPAPYLSLMSVVPLGAQWDLTGAFNLHSTDDRWVHTSVYTASTDPFCKVFISSVHLFIRFPYWFLGKLFYCNVWDDESFVGSMSYKYCLHICALHCLNGILWQIKSFNFNSMM